MRSNLLIFNLSLQDNIETNTDVEMISENSTETTTASLLTEREANKKCLCGGHFWGSRSLMFVV